MGKPVRYSAEVRERAVRLVLEQAKAYTSQWAAIVSIAEKFGCSPETLRNWVRTAEREHEPEQQSLTAERERIKELERENRQLKQANEILRKAAAFFAQRGAQYLSIHYTKRLADAGIAASVGSKGDSYDNALAETIIGLYKSEVVHHLGPWASVIAVEVATLEGVHWYNNHRLLEPFGYIPPSEYEQAYHQQQESSGVLTQAISPPENPGRLR